MRQGCRVYFGFRGLSRGGTKNIGIPPRLQLTFIIPYLTLTITEVLSGWFLVMGQGPARAGFLGPGRITSGARLGWDPQSARGPLSKTNSIVNLLMKSEISRVTELEIQLIGKSYQIEFLIFKLEFTLELAFSRCECQYFLSPARGDAGTRGAKNIGIPPDYS